MLRLRFIAGGRVFGAMGRYLAEEAALNKVKCSHALRHLSQGQQLSALQASQSTVLMTCMLYSTMQISYTLAKHKLVLSAAVPITRALIAA